MKSHIRLADGDNSALPVLDVVNHELYDGVLLEDEVDLIAEYCVNVLNRHSSVIGSFDVLVESDDSQIQW